MRSTYDMQNKTVQKRVSVNFIYESHFKTAPGGFVKIRQRHKKNVGRILQLMSISMHMQRQTERGGIVLCCGIVCRVSDEVLC